MSVSSFVPPAKAAFWKLGGVYKWITIAPYIKSVAVTFDPVDSEVSGVREFYRQTCSPKARKAYPKYDTTLVMDEGLQAPFVKVAFADGREVKYAAKGQSVNALNQVIYYDCLDLIMSDENAA